MSKMTPGPWKVLKGHTGNTWFVVYKTRETKQRTEAARVFTGIHLVTSGDETAPAVAGVDSVGINHSANKDANMVEAAANAQAIAALPDLIEALQAALRIEELWMPGPLIEAEHAGEAQALAEMRNLMLAALKKAGIE